MAGFKFPAQLWNGIRKPGPAEAEELVNCSSHLAGMRLVVHGLEEAFTLRNNL
jgi:hypothetical protein